MPQVTKDFSIMGSTLKPGGNLNAASMIGRLRPGQKLSLRRQPGNPIDHRAIYVMWGTWPLGYVPAGLAAIVAPLMDAGVNVIAQKAPNGMFGVCQLAYIEPAPKAVEPKADAPVETAELISVEEAEALITKEALNAEPNTDPTAESV